MKKSNCSVVVMRPQGTTKLKKISAMVVGLLSLGLLEGFEERAYGAPSGAVIQHGEVVIDPPKPKGDFSYQQITQSTDKAIIDWQTFNVEAHEHVHFQLPTAQAATLNRVVGQDLSKIAGKLSSTGQLYLVNPNGVVFSKGAQVDAAGIIASTMQITNQNFLNNQYTFTPQENALDAAIINQGTLSTHQQGTIALIAGQVNNAGIISAKLGQVVLGAGQTQATLDFYGDELLSFAASEQSTQARIDHSGQINADGGRVLVTTHSLNQVLSESINLSGVIEANTAYEQNGEIILTAGDQGKIHLSGTLEAKGNANTDGGKINITGHTIDMTASAKLDASGQSGGEIILFAEYSTTVAGTLHAKGLSGDGGFIETSGHTVKLQKSDVKVSGTNGTKGKWLIDPVYTTINQEAADTIAAALDAGENGADYEIQSDQNTTITIEEGVNLSWNKGSALIIEALGNLVIESGANISAPNGSLEISSEGIIDVKGAINVANFEILAGDWQQIVGQNDLSALPDFNVTGNFHLDSTNSTFKRFAGGDGSADAPYQLTDIFGLQGLDTFATENNYYQLNNHIDASTTTNWHNAAIGLAGFKPIGFGGDEFMGNFNGNGYTISNLKIQFTGEVNANDVGLFSVIGESAAINALGLTDVFISIPTNIWSAGTGGLAGVIYGATISNSYVTGSIIGNASVGGLVGQAFTGTIENSYSSASVRGDYAIGGLIGDTTESTISNSFATGTIAGGSVTGGLIGFAGNSTISHSYATGSVSGVSGLGGLIGTATDNTTVSKSFASGNVLGEQYVGGLIGNNRESVITESFTIGAVTSQAIETRSFAVGGLVGVNTGEINSSFSTGLVTVDSNDSKHYGGLIGVSNTEVINSFWNTQTSGQTTGIGSIPNGDPTGLTGVNTTKMMQGNTFAEWDFENTWGIFEDSSYPYLKALTPTPQIIRGSLQDSGNSLLTGQSLTLGDSDYIYNTASAADGSYYFFVPNTDNHIGFKANEAFGLYVESESQAQKTNLIYQLGETAPTTPLINLDLIAGQLYLSGEAPMTTSTLSTAFNANNGIIPQNRQVSNLNFSEGHLTADQVVITTPVSLGDLTVNGPSKINADVTTTGSQTYTGAVTLGNDVTLTGTSGSWNSIDGQGNDLLLGFSEGNQLLGSTLTNIDGLGATTLSFLSGTFTANELALSSATLSADTTINNDLTVSGTLTGGSNSLSVLGDAELQTVTGLNTLTITGTTTANGNITTTGSQSYENVTLGNDVTLTGTSGSWDSIDGGNNDLILSFSEGNQLVGSTFANIDGLAATTHSTLSGTFTANEVALSSATLSADTTINNDLTVSDTLTGDSNSLSVLGDAELHSVSDLTTLTVNGTTTANGDISATTITLDDLVTNVDSTFAGTDITWSSLDGNDNNVTATALNALSFDTVTETNALELTADKLLALSSGEQPSLQANTADINVNQHYSVRVNVDDLVLNGKNGASISGTISGTVLISPSAQKVFTYNGSLLNPSRQVNTRENIDPTKNGSEINKTAATVQNEKGQIQQEANLIIDLNEGNVIANLTMNLGGFIQGGIITQEEADVISEAAKKSSTLDELRQKLSDSFDKDKLNMLIQAFANHQRTLDRDLVNTIGFGGGAAVASIASVASAASVASVGSIDFLMASTGFDKGKTKK